MSKVVTVFRSRLKPEGREEYFQTAARMSEIARAMPGYLSHKVFTAEDGERVTIVEFEGAEAHDSWRFHPDHLAAKQRGVAAFYSEYSIRVCDVVRSHDWKAKG